MNNTFTTAMRAAANGKVNGWNDLNKIAAVMTSSGPAKGDSFQTLILNDDYRFAMAHSSPDYIAECMPIETSLANYNVRGCLNTQSGAIQIKSGDGKDPAETPVCN